MKFGSGEYMGPDALSARPAARRVFLEQMETAAPEILDWLATNILPAYKEIAPLLDRMADERLATIDADEEYKWEWLDFWVWAYDALLREAPRDRLPLEGEAEEITEKAAVFCRRLALWEQQYGLTDEWMREVARDTLDAWYRHGVPELLRWQPSGIVFFPRRFPSFTVTCSGWDPERETQAKYEAGARRLFEKELDRHTRSVGDTVTALGWERTPEKNNMEHFSWLIRYHCLRETQVQVASEHRKPTGEKGVALCHVSTTVNELARLVGLTLRPPRTGKGSRPGHSTPGHVGRVRKRSHH